jgi:hypothetical protein
LGFIRYNVMMAFFYDHDAGTVQGDAPVGV